MYQDMKKIIVDLLADSKNEWELHFALKEIMEDAEQVLTKRQVKQLNKLI